MAKTSAALPPPLWQHPQRHAAAYFAVAGDFLPAMGLAGSAPAAWAAQRSLLQAALAEVQGLFVNLECPLDCADLAPATKAGFGQNLRAGSEVLSYFGLPTFLGIANNHIYDFGPGGVERTRAAAQAQGFPIIGAGHSLASEPEVLLAPAGANGRIGFWAACLNAAHLATARKEGVEVFSVARARQAVARLKAQGATVTVALVHAGLEGSFYPDPDDARKIREAIHAGFDVICCAHSHRISGFELVPKPEGTEAGLVFYGLGSLCSGCIYGDPEREGLVVVLGLTEAGTLASVRVHPIELLGEGWGSAALSPKTQSIMARFEALSGCIADGSAAREFYKESGQGLISRQWGDAREAYRRAGIGGVMAKLFRLRKKHLQRLFHQLAK